MIDPDIAQWALIILIVFIGSAIQGVIGYGVGLFSAPLLFLIEPALVPAPLIIIGGILPLLVLRANLTAVVPRDLAVALPAGVLGVVGAWLMAGLLPVALWQQLFGVMILIAVAASVLRLRIQPTAPAVFVSSLLSGWMGTISGVGGPPLGVVYQHAEPARVRGTLSAIFVPMSVVTLIALYFMERLGWREVWLAVFMLPAVFAGFACARRWGARIPRQMFRVVALGTSLVAGAYAALSGFV